MINDQLMEEMKTYSLKHVPREACALIVKVSDEYEFFPCRNISEIENTFIIDPVDYADAEDKGEIVRVLHSHVYCDPSASEIDRVSCESSGLPWSIISVPNGDWYHFGPSGYKAPLVGRTWAHGVQDCYTLIKDYYEQCFNIVLPDFAREHEWWLRGGNLYAENFEKLGFFEIPFSQIQTGDVVLMQVMSKVINHGAIFSGNDKILHHLFKRLSGHDVYSGYWKKHTVKILRFRK